MADKTREVIAGMLKENTGTHFLDSGGAYGRAWERNQSREFENEPEVDLSFKFGIELSLNVYHWLVDKLHYEEEMDKLFHRWAGMPWNKDCYWMELMERFAKNLDGRGIYGEGEPVTVNTYNGEDLVSQTLQYTYFFCDRGDFVLLQIHGGCDVRGGYTAPRVFSVNDECALFRNADGTIQCTNEREHYWNTDDAYHYYFQGSCGYGAGTELQEYEQIKEDDLEPKGLERVLIKTYGDVVLTQEILPLGDDLPSGEIREVLSEELGGVIGYLFVDEDGNGYCPHCGHLLEGCAY